MIEMQFEIKVFEEELATAAQALESREERMQEVFKTTIFLHLSHVIFRFSAVWKNVLRCLEQLQWRTSSKMGWVKRWLPSVRPALGCGC